jgi:hypothetical protein
MTKKSEKFFETHMDPALTPDSETYSVRMELMLFDLFEVSKLRKELLYRSVEQIHRPVFCFYQRQKSTNH